jgi:hypothetical protein
LTVDGLACDFVSHARRDCRKPTEVHTCGPGRQSRTDYNIFYLPWIELTAVHGVPDGVRHQCRRLDVIQ